MIKPLKINLKYQDTMFSRIEMDINNSVRPVDGLYFYKIVCGVMREYLSEYFLRSQVTHQTEELLKTTMKNLSNSLEAHYMVKTLPYDVQIGMNHCDEFVLNMIPVDIYDLDVPYIRGGQ